jgi:tRNA(fMet)-specific endonuclease VapC
VTPANGLVLLDTNILLHVIRATSLAAQIDTEHSLRRRSDRPLVSIVTVGESLAFAKKNGWGTPKTSKLRELIHQLVIVDINPDDIIEQYASLDAYCEAHGKVLGKNDLWIAATAAVTGALLLTTDKDFIPLQTAGLLSCTWYDPSISKPGSS